MWLPFGACAWCSLDATLRATAANQAAQQEKSALAPPTAVAKAGPWSKASAANAAAKKAKKVAKARNSASADVMRRPDVHGGRQRGIILVRR